MLRFYAEFKRMHWPVHKPYYAVVVPVLLGVWCLGYSWLRGHETVVVIVSRTEGRALPPFEYVTDRDRLLGLVFEPLCPPPPDQRPLQLPVPALANCTIVQGQVEVRLSPDAQWQGKPLDAEATAALLIAHERRRIEQLPSLDPLWETLEKDDKDSRVLRLTPGGSSTTQGLRFALSELLLGTEQDACRVGSGRWVEQVCAADLSVKRLLLPRALRESQFVTDIAVLERHDWLFQRRRVLVVGWDSTDGTADLVGPLAAGLKGAIGQRIHLIRGLESPEIQLLREQLKVTVPKWSLVSRMGDRTAWLVARPTLPRADRLQLLNAARDVLRSPEYFDESSGSPSLSLLPEVYRPLFFAGSSSVSQPHEACKEGAQVTVSQQPPVLLTHSRWRSLAERLREQKKVNLKLDIFDVNGETPRRRNGEYELSIQSPVAQDTSHPARIFADNLTAWFSAEHPLMIQALQIAQTEATDLPKGAEALKGLLRCLDDYMLPISSPPTWVVVHEDLRGWNAAADWLDPTDVGLRSYSYRWLDLAGLLLLVLAIPLYLFLRWLRDEHARTIAEIASFHHDMCSPLASIRAEVEYLREDLAEQSSPATGAVLRNCAELIDHQASHVIDLVDNLKAVSDPRGFLAVEQTLSCALLPLLQMEREVLQGLARLERVDLQLAINVAEDLRVALPASAVRRVLRNLLDNAFKYRQRESSTATIRVTARQESSGLILDIEDDGVGFDDLPKALRFQPRQRGTLARERQLPGQGLGLSSTYRLLTAAGAQIEISRNSGPTRVRLRLPMAARSGK